MGIPVWVPGQVLASSDVNEWFVPRAVVKPTLQSISSSTTMTNDTALFLPVDANATYIFDCFLIMTAAAGGDFKWTWTAPAGTGMNYAPLHNEGSSTGLGNSVNNYLLTTIGFAVGPGAGNFQMLVMHGTVGTGSTSGTLQLQWAQNTSNGTATGITVGSHLMLRRVA